MLLDNKKQLAQELQSEVNILNILLSQEKQGKDRTERDLNSTLQANSELQQTVQALQQELGQANIKYDGFSRDFEKAE